MAKDRAGQPGERRSGLHQMEWGCAGAQRACPSSEVVVARVDARMHGAEFGCIRMGVPGWCAKWRTAAGQQSDAGDGCGRPRDDHHPHPADDPGARRPETGGVAGRVRVDAAAAGPRTLTAERLGVSFASVNRWEGGTKLPKKAARSTIAALGADAGVDTEDPLTNRMPKSGASLIMIWSGSEA